MINHEYFSKSALAQAGFRRGDAEARRQKNRSIDRNHTSPRPSPLLPKERGGRIIRLPLANRTHHPCSRVQYTKSKLEGFLPGSSPRLRVSALNPL
jgi:hypothetical protein